MNKLIGGLLVISLLSNPSLLRVDYIAYEIYKLNEIIVDYFLNEQKEHNLNLTEDIEEMIHTIELNKRQINMLAAAKNDIVKKIETRMDLNSYAKSVFNEEQITSFTEFIKIYENEKLSLTDNYEKLYAADYIGMQNMLLQEYTDYTYLQDQLADMRDKQFSIIHSLEKIVSYGEALINVI